MQTAPKTASDWITTARHWIGEGRDSTAIIVAETKGSAPRRAGTVMLATEDAQWGTIGGGKLELTAIDQARALLSQGLDGRWIDFPLGPLLGQCCGGHVRLALIRIDSVTLDRLAAPPAGAFIDHRDPPKGTCLWLDETEPRLHRKQADDGPVCLVDPCRVRPRLFLFGAGHVGRALASALAPLPIDLVWLDTRPDWLDPSYAPEAEARLVKNPDALEDAITQAPAQSLYVIMTHDHGIDYRLVKAALGRGDAAFVGLIGSDTKRARFVKSLLRETDMDRDQIESALSCPIGLAGITGNEPSVIAVAAAAQILTLISEQ